MIRKRSHDHNISRNIATSWWLPHLTCWQAHWILIVFSHLFANPSVSLWSFELFGHQWAWARRSLKLRDTYVVDMACINETRASYQTLAGSLELKMITLYFTFTGAEQRGEKIKPNVVYCHVHIIETPQGYFHPLKLTVHLCLSLLWSHTLLPQ